MALPKWLGLRAPQFWAFKGGRLVENSSDSLALGSNPHDACLSAGKMLKGIAMHPWCESTFWTTKSTSLALSSSMLFLNMQSRCSIFKTSKGTGNPRSPQSPQCQLIPGQRKGWAATKCLRSEITSPCSRQISMTWHRLIFLPSFVPVWYLNNLTYLSCVCFVLFCCLCKVCLEGDLTALKTPLDQAMPRLALRWSCEHAGIRHMGIQRSGLKWWQCQMFPAVLFWRWPAISASQTCHSGSCRRRRWLLHSEHLHGLHRPRTAP